MSYDTYEVAPGGTESFTLGDGESLTDTLIDISAEGSTFEITADGDNWTIENVGIRGYWDATEKAEPITVEGTGTVSDLYFGDGAAGFSFGTGPTGIYVPPTHAGELTLERVFVRGLPGSGINASDPGHPDAGSGGDVHISECYAADTTGAAFRLGTDGSTLDDCVAITSGAGVWALFGEPTTSNCDFAANADRDVRVGSSSFDHEAVVHLENVRYDHERVHQGEIDGESAGSARRTSPRDLDVPRWPEEAVGVDEPDEPPVDPDDGDADFGASTLPAARIGDTWVEFRGEVHLDDRDADTYFEYQTTD